MTRAVLLTKQVPWPSDSGGRIRETHVVEVFRRHFDEVHVVAFGRQPAADSVPAGVVVHAFPGPTLARGALRSRSLAVGRWYSSALAGRVGDLLEPGAHLHAGFSHMAVDAPDLGRVDSLDLHNVESDLLRQRALQHPNRLLRPVLRVEAVRLAAWERGLARVGLVTCVSEQDRLRLREMGVTAIVAANGTVLPGRVAPLPADERAVFVGSLDWAPNVEGALWLSGEVWPLVRRVRPDARVALVGRSPSPLLRALHAPGVELAADVPTVTPWYAGSRFAVCPLLTGGGSRLKILEALAHGRPVVSTALGAEGLEDLVGHGVVLADGARDFAASVTHLLRDDAACRDLGARGRAAVAARWSWDSTLSPLDAALRRRSESAGTSA